MSNELEIYRRRYIPAELIFLKDDEVLHYEPGKLLVTRWSTINPKAAFATGTSAFFIDKCIKVTKLRDEHGNFCMWYCDIVETEETPGRIVYNDLLFDVIEKPDGTVQVVDIGEAADAFDTGLITKEQLLKGMYALENLLSSIRDGSFNAMKKTVEDAEKL